MPAQIEANTIKAIIVIIVHTIQSNSPPPPPNTNPHPPPPPPLLPPLLPPLPPPLPPLVLTPNESSLRSIYLLITMSVTCYEKHDSKYPQKQSRKLHAESLETN